MATWAIAKRKTPDEIKKGANREKREWFERYDKSKDIVYFTYGLYDFAKRFSSEQEAEDCIKILYKNKQIAEENLKLRKIYGEDYNVINIVKCVGG